MKDRGMLHSRGGSNNAICVPVEDIETIASRVAPFRVSLDSGKPYGNRALNTFNRLLLRCRCPERERLFKIVFNLPCSTKQGMDTEDSTKFPHGGL